MKKLVGIVGMALATNIAVAEENAGKADNASICAPLGELAENIMLVRQQEYPMRKLLVDEEAPVVRHLIREAYKHSAYRMESNQERAAAEFGNQIHLECLNEADKLE